MFGKEKRVGVALGSGGARGWAHLGALRAMRECGIAAHCVAGTSMGSLGGAALAGGSVTTLERIALELDWKQVLYFFLEFNLPRNGLIDGERIVTFVREQIVGKNIEDLPVPYHAVAADVLTGEEVVLDRGDVVDAVRASISIPGMFTPVQRDNHLLVDGGVVNPVPVTAVAKMGAEVTIAVNISNRFATEVPAPLPEREARETPAPQPEPRSRWEEIVSGINDKIRLHDFGGLQAVKHWVSKPALPNVFDILGDSFRIMETQLAATQLANNPPDILIEPRLAGVGFMEFHRAAEIIESGYVAARDAFAARPHVVKSCGGRVPEEWRGSKEC